MTDKRIALTTCGSEDEAARIAAALVERRVAACVNIVPGLRSFYRWRGETHDDAEWLLVIKTDAARLDDLRAAIERLHSYDLPEFIALPIVAGSAGYLNWIGENLGSEPPSQSSSDDSAGR